MQNLAPVKFEAPWIFIPPMNFMFHTVNPNFMEMTFRNSWFPH